MKGFLNEFVYSLNYNYNYNYLVEPYNDLDTLFSSTLIDGVCLNRDWDKLIEIGCEPDMEYMDDVIETYKKEALKRQSKFKQTREKGC